MVLVVFMQHKVLITRCTGTAKWVTSYWEGQPAITWYLADTRGNMGRSVTLAFGRGAGAGAN